MAVYLYIIIGLIVVGLIGLIIIIVDIFKKNDDKDKTDKVKGLTVAVENLKTNLPPGQIGPQGPPGERGEPGPPGGTFERQGPLRNLGKTNLVADRMYGSGPLTVAYLNESNFKPHQHWTLKSDKTVENQFGGCLEGNNITGDVYMSSCDNTSSKQRWIFDKNGRLFLYSFPDKCISTSLQGKFTGMPAIQHNKPTKSRTHNDIIRLKLEKCDNSFPINQQWAFY